MKKFHLLSQLLFLKGQNHGKLNISSYSVREFKECCCYQTLAPIILNDHLGGPSVLEGWLGFPSGIGQIPHLCSLMWGSRGQAALVSSMWLGCWCHQSRRQSPWYVISELQAASHLVSGWPGCLVFQSEPLPSQNQDSCSPLKEEG